MNNKNFKIIALMDCDSFFVSCEQYYNPSYKNKPVCVLSNNDGCVISRSKEAKALGVKMGMPLFMAKKEYPNVIYLSSDHEKYADISKNTMGLLREFSPIVDQYSIDEAFIDLTGLRRLYRRSYLEIAKMIREEVRLKIGIPVSIGVSLNKTLAKLATSYAKKQDGTYIIGYRALKEKLLETDFSEVWGVGKNTSALMNKYGIHTAYEFSMQSDEWIKSKLGIRGLQLKQELLGNIIYDISSISELPKSIQKTSSFASFTSDKSYIKNSLIYHINRATYRLRKLKMKAGCIRIILKTKDFKIYSEKCVLNSHTSWDTDIVNAILPIFEKMYKNGIIYRSSGIVLENLLCENDIQMSLFNNIQTEYKKENLSHCVDNLIAKHGRNIIKVGYSEPPQKPNN